MGWLDVEKQNQNYILIHCKVINNVIKFVNMKKIVKKIKEFLFGKAKIEVFAEDRPKKPRGGEEGGDA